MGSSWVLRLKEPVGVHHLIGRGSILSTHTCRVREGRLADTSPQPDFLKHLKWKGIQSVQIQSWTNLIYCGVYDKDRLRQSSLTRFLSRGDEMRLMTWAPFFCCCYLFLIHPSSSTFFHDTCRRRWEKLIDLQFPGDKVWETAGTLIKKIISITGDRTRRDEKEHLTRRAECNQSSNLGDIFFLKIDFTARGGNNGEQRTDTVYPVTIYKWPWEDEQTHFPDYREIKP